MNNKKGTSQEEKPLIFTDFLNAEDLKAQKFDVVSLKEGWEWVDLNTRQGNEIREYLINHDYEKLTPDAPIVNEIKECVEGRTVLVLCFDPLYFKSFLLLAKAMLVQTKAKKVVFKKI